MNSEGAGGAAHRPVARDGARRLLILCSALFCHGIMCSVCHIRVWRQPSQLTELSMNLKLNVEALVSLQLEAEIL